MLWNSMSHWCLIYSLGKSIMFPSELYPGAVASMQNKVMLAYLVRKWTWLMELHGRDSCAAGEVWILIHGIFLPLLTYKKKGKEIKRTNRKYDFGCFCQDLSKTERRFHAAELGTELQKSESNTWCQTLSLWRHREPLAKPIPLQKGLHAPLLWKARTCSWHWNLASSPGRVSYSVYCVSIGG